MKNRPALNLIIATDYGASVAAVLPFVTGGIALLIRLIKPSQADRGILAVFLAITGACLLMIAWRVLRIWYFFDHSDTCPGRIKSIEVTRDRQRMEYIYTYHGKRLTGNCALMKNPSTKKLKAGVQITVLVNPHDPKRSLVRELYV